MPESNGSQVQSHEPNFKDAYHEAVSTGDFSFVLKTAKESHRMLVDFKAAVSNASFSGRDAGAIGCGLQFMDNLINQAAAQVDQLKRTEKMTRDAIRAAQKNPQQPEIVGVGPEDVPAEPVVEPQDPNVPDVAPPPAVDGWETPTNG